MAAKKVSFALSFWRVSEDLMVVDSRHSELALPVEKLLNNILFALGYPRQLPKVDALSWPMVDAPHQDQGENAARDTLHGFNRRVVFYSTLANIFCLWAKTPADIY